MASVSSSSTNGTLLLEMIVRTFGRAIATALGLAIRAEKGLVLYVIIRCLGMQFGIQSSISHILYCPYSSETRAVVSLTFDPTEVASELRVPNTDLEEDRQFR